MLIERTDPRAYGRHSMRETMRSGNDLRTGHLSIQLYLLKKPEWTENLIDNSVVFSENLIKGLALPF